MISLTKRQMDILKQLLGQADYINVKQLAELYEVSERTIRYDLDFIESFLKEYDVTLIRKPGKGIYVRVK
ncbi:HTH domain-containing protein [Heyndrickxia sporothermodurans]|uniref:HTH domain-containing protein n=1 Tax=Heyndrickxia sporothermodurans TaxID=46224 RepID=UPI00192C163B|nr:HTH domain-containing protein [Heyndrickxia sporothermodurans]MBL5889451.1 HTH domain-containing protein [Heyndrickxia sporothermodurans]MBL5896711.1 HTH domain-containing protein [Heyndrickxia sporothermodurans]